MDKLAKEFMYERINQALIDDEEYRKLEANEKDETIVQAKAEEICYKAGFNDALNLILRGLN